MQIGGKLLGSTIIVVVFAVLFFSVQYTDELRIQRERNLEQITSLPQYEECAYDDDLCPQAQEKNIILPSMTGVALVILGILLGVYLIRSDHTHRTILEELRAKRAVYAEDERREIVLGVLTKDEAKIVKAVEQQPGISQATLRLRVDMSKAKLSTILKDLEKRKLIKRTMKGKTNVVYVKW